MGKAKENINELLEEWHETKSIAIATDICEKLWEEMANVR